jgi:hypothetical protein
MNTSPNSQSVNNSIPKLVNLAKLAAKKKKEDEVGTNLTASENAAAEIASRKVLRSTNKAFESGIPVYKIPEVMRQTSEETRFAGGVDEFEVFPMTGKEVQPVTDAIVNHLLGTSEMKIILLEKDKATLKAELDEAKKKLKKKHDHIVQLQRFIVENNVKNGIKKMKELEKTWQGGRKTRRKKTEKKSKKRKSKKRKRRKNN